jgi:exodeoxyribonuclease VII large subunit
MVEVKQGSLYFDAPEDDPKPPPPPPRRRFLTVSEFTNLLRGIFEAEFSDIFIAGEISGTKQPPSGHYYFTLKDANAELSCVVYKSAVRFLRFKPRDGVAVIARGRLDAYGGRYQLIVETLEPQGHGALQFAYEQLKKKLTAEGLFEQERKRPLPRLPRRIGIVTSPSGAVIQDMLRILERRFKGLHIRIYPALVQGEGSIEQVCRGLQYFSQSGWPDVIILARGGGSLEDLWTFNEEAVARAIAASKVPVISAIGHETDVTIADFVADLRAPTPSAAAELVVPTQEQLVEQIAASRNKIIQAMRYRLAQFSRRLHQRGTDRAAIVLRSRIGRAQQKLDESGFRLREAWRALLENRRRRVQQLASKVQQRDVRLQFGDMHRRLERISARLEQAIGRRLSRAQARLGPAAAHLSQLSPLKILDRGYAIVQNEAGQLVKSPEGAAEGSKIQVRLADGKLNARVI